MDKIPVKFDYKGKVVQVVLSCVMGAGCKHMFHLNVGGYHWGQFWLTEHYGWRVASNHKDLSGLVDYFERWL